MDFLSWEAVAYDMNLLLTTPPDTCLIRCTSEQRFLSFEFMGEESNSRCQFSDL